MVRLIIDEKLRADQREALRTAAERMSQVYAGDRELTAFTALDGEDFIAQG